MPTPSRIPDQVGQKSFRIKHDEDKLCTKILSKESSKSTPSFRVYYGDVSSAVPFTWETCPGTPKHNTFFDHSDLPPLTPPPSYYAENSKNYYTKKNSRSKLLLHTLLRRMSIPKKTGHSFGSPLSSSSVSSMSNWSSSSRSSFSDLMMTTPSRHKRRRTFSSWGSSFDDRAMNEPASCFGKDKDTTTTIVSFCIVKKALLSIIGRSGSA